MKLNIRRICGISLITIGLSVASVPAFAASDHGRPGQTGVHQDQGKPGKKHDRHDRQGQPGSKPGATATATAQPSGTSTASPAPAATTEPSSSAAAPAGTSTTTATKTASGHGDGPCRVTATKPVLDTKSLTLSSTLTVSGCSEPQTVTDIQHYYPTINFIKGQCTNDGQCAPVPGGTHTAKYANGTYTLTTKVPQAAIDGKWVLCFFQWDIHWENCNHKLLTSAHGPAGGVNCKAPQPSPTTSSPSPSTSTSTTTSPSPSTSKTTSPQIGTAISTSRGPEASTGTDTLAFTGANVLAPVLIAAALIIGGFLLYFGVPKPSFSRARRH